MKTYLDVLEETYKYYTEDPNRRAVIGEKCSYYDKGKMCAVGRCLKNPEKVEKIYSNWAAWRIPLGEVLKKEYKHLTSQSFWAKLQWFHDAAVNWNKDGITKSGQIIYEELKAEYEGKNS